MNDNSTTSKAARRAEQNPNGIICPPRFESLMSGVAHYKFTPDGKMLTAVYVDGTEESCQTSHDTMILLLAIYSCIVQEKALPEFSSFALVSEVQSHRKAA